MSGKAPVVLFVHQAAEMYGSDKVLLYIATGLRARGRVWPVVVLPMHGPLLDFLEAAGVEVHVCEVGKISRQVYTPLGLVRLMYRVWRTLVLYDVIRAGRTVAVVHSNTLAVLAGAVWAWRRAIPHLWHVHEIILSPRLASSTFPRMVSWLSDCVVSNSRPTERWLLEHQPGLAARSKVVFNGLPLQYAASEAQATAFRAQVGAATDTLLVVLAGRLNQWKGQGLLIEAVAHLHGQGRLGNTRFVIVGDAIPGQPHWRARLVANVHALGVQAHVHFEPYVDDIRAVWQAADIAVVPSTEPEPFGLVAIEAMAAGVPVVAAGHGGLLDIIEHGQSGLLFEPRNALALADALGSLMADGALRQRLGASGRLRQQALFLASSQVEALENIYIALAGLPKMASS